MLDCRLVADILIGNNLVKMQDIIAMADKLIADCPVQLTVEIATELAPLPDDNLREAGDYPPSKYCNDSFRPPHSGGHNASELPPLGAGQGAKFDALLPALAAQGVAGSAGRIEALREAYEWRELLGDDSSPFTVSNEQIAAFATEYFARNARYSGGGSSLGVESAEDDRGA